MLAYLCGKTGATIAKWCGANDATAHWIGLAAAFFPGGVDGIGYMAYLGETICRSCDSEVAKHMANGIAVTVGITGTSSELDALGSSSNKTSG
jgi:hypothetical protein